MDTDRRFRWTSPWTLQRFNDGRTRCEVRPDEEEPEVRQGNRTAFVATVTKEDNGLILLLCEEGKEPERWLIAEHSLADKIEYELASLRIRR